MALSQSATAVKIKEQLLESSRTLAETAGETGVIEAAAARFIEAYRNGNKIMAFGNGGSSCDAQNFADELVGRFERNRPPPFLLSP